MGAARAVQAVRMPAHRGPCCHPFDIMFGEASTTGGEGVVGLSEGKARAARTISRNLTRKLQPFPC
jgi:hypothetical protein